MRRPVRLPWFASALTLTLALASPASARQGADAGIPESIRDQVCAPLPRAVAPATRITVAGSHELRKTLFGTGESVIVKAGTAQGLRAGDQFFVRRIVHDRFIDTAGETAPVSVHTAGVLRISEALPDVAVATVSYACDGVSEGDYLERFDIAALPASATDRAPDFSSPGRVVLGDERQQIGAAGDFMIVNRGADQGLQPGQLVTIYRTPAGPSGPVTTIGTARVYVVLPGSSTIRIERSVDAVYLGDLVAIHR